MKDGHYLSCCLANDKSYEAQVTYMSAGRFFGEMSLLTGKARSASIKAEETCKLIQVGVAPKRRWWVPVLSWMMSGALHGLG